MIPSHTLVAQACLGIFLHLNRNVSKDVLKKIPLAEYAGEHWVGHARFEGVLGNAEQVIAIGGVIYPRGKGMISISTSSKCNNLRPTFSILLWIGSFLHTFSLPSPASLICPFLLRSFQIRPHPRQRRVLCTDVTTQSSRRAPGQVLGYV